MIVGSGGEKREWMLEGALSCQEDGDVARRNGGGNPFVRQLI